MRRLIVSLGLATAAVTAAATLVMASAGGDVPPNWHIHDGQTSLGPQHKGIGFFPTILGLTPSEYLADPAQCPNATDKAFLPSNDTNEAALLRAGICVTSDLVIHLQTVPAGTSGPDGWSSVTASSEPGWVTYYFVTPR
jgi:hypothetical protein